MFKKLFLFLIIYVLKNIRKKFGAENVVLPLNLEEMNSNMVNILFIGR